MENKESMLNYILLLIGAILIIIFQKNLLIVTGIIAVGGIVFGIINVIGKKSEGYVMLGAGLSVMAGIILNKVGLLEVGDAITFVIACAIAITMILAIIVELFRRQYIMKTHTLIVEAELIDLVRNTNVKKEIYMPVYSYKVDKEIYEVNYIKYLSKKLPSIGSTKPLRVNPKNHGDVYFEPETKDKVLYVCCAVVLAIASIAVVVSLFV